MHTIKILPECLKEEFTGFIEVKIPSHRERIALLQELLKFKNDEIEEDTMELSVVSFYISACEKFIVDVKLEDKSQNKIENFESLERDLRTTKAFTVIGNKLTMGFKLGENLGSL